MSEKLCLKWNDFQDNIKNAFGCLRADKNFTDVTLASEDGKEFEAHKIVMAASSPFFQNLLKKNHHPHPLVYMRGLGSEYLEAILDFLYCGEANVFRESLDSFLAIAEELQLIGLMRSGNDQDIQNDVEINTNGLKSKLNPSLAMDKPPFHGNPKEVKEELYQPVKSNSTVAIATNFSDDSQAIEKMVQSMLEKSETNRRTGICKVCGKEGKSQNIKRHIEANHLEDVFSLPCNLCGKIFRSRNGLWEHKHMYCPQRTPK